MSTAIIDSPSSATGPASDPIVVLKRRSIDTVLVSFGVLAALVFAVAGGLLAWGNNFSSDYVTKELSSQHVSFPPAAALTAEGRTDLLGHAGHVVNNGNEAQAYASYINGHLAKIGAGKTFAELKAPLDAANASVAAAVKSGASTADVSALQTQADAVTRTRNSLFQGETLRGLLLSAYAWGKVGTIAGIAAIVAFVAAGLMALLSILGIVHHTRMPKRI